MRGTVLSLCDRTGNMVKPWADAGYQAVTVDLQQGKNSDCRVHVCEDVRWLDEHWVKGVNPVAVFAFPPCTHVAVSGAKHFQSKGLDKLIEALDILNACRKICERSGAPYMIENPVSVFSTHWRKPDHYFHPWHYTAFSLDDHYTKKTCLWTGNGFVMPEPMQHPALVDIAPDDRIHKAPPSEERGDIRSATPIGFARAVFLANAPHLRLEAAE